MAKQVVLVAGGTGFLGRRVVKLLQTEGHHVIVYHRKHQAVPTHADIIVNCVGIIREDEGTFKDVHVEFLKWLVRLGKKLHVKKFVQVSALGCEMQTTSYQKTKIQAEHELKESELPYIIIRPSMLFGSGDKSINIFRKICRTGFFPIFGNGRVQPVHVQTVANLIVNTALSPTKNRTIEVGGPEIFTYRQLAERIHPGVRSFRMPILGILIVTTLAHIVRSFPTKEQVTMLAQENIVHDAASVAFLQRLQIENPRLH